MSGASLALLVPSRGRPDNARRLLHACADTASDVVVFIGVDSNDPKFFQYLEIATEHLVPGTVVVLPSETSNGTGMVGALNWLAQSHAQDYEMIAFMGDDHIPVTPNWDVELCHSIRMQGGGLAYGNDLLQGEALPTAVVMESRIPKVLGYMAPPVLEHLWVDNFWLQLGQGIGQISYLGDVVIEHLHPGVGKAEWDQEYARTGSSDKDQRDKKAFEEYCKYQLQADVRKLSYHD